MKPWNAIMAGVFATWAVCFVICLCWLVFVAKSCDKSIFFLNEAGMASCLAGMFMHLKGEK